MGFLGKDKKEAPKTLEELAAVAIAGNPNQVVATTRRGDGDNEMLKLMVSHGYKAVDIATTSTGRTKILFEKISSTT